MSPRPTWLHGKTLSPKADKKTSNPDTVCKASECQGTGGCCSWVSRRILCPLLHPTDSPVPETSDPAHPPRAAGPSHACRFCLATVVWIQGLPMQPKLASSLRNLHALISTLKSKVNLNIVPSLLVVTLSMQVCALLQSGKCIELTVTRFFFRLHQSCLQCCACSVVAGSRLLPLMALCCPCPRRRWPQRE